MWSSVWRWGAPVAAVGLGLWVVQLRVRADTGPWPEIIAVTAGPMLFVLAGVVAQLWQPDNRVGPRMVLLGAAIFTESLQLSTHPVVHVVGALLRGASNGPLALLILSFPDGRLVGRLKWSIVVTAFGTTAATALLAVTVRPDALMRGPLPLWPDLRVYDDASLAVNLVVSAIVLASLALITIGWFRADGETRRATGPMVAIGLAGGLIAASDPVPQRGTPVGDALHFGYSVATVLWPLAFLFGVVRTAAGLAAAVQAADQLRLREVASVRRTIERDLHDGAQGNLVVASLNLSLGLQMLEEGEAGALDALHKARGAIDTALAELRDLARGIYPAVLEGTGLGDAIRELVLRSPLSVDLVTDGIDELPAAVSAVTYFVVAEALTNVLKHAGVGTARVEIRCDGAEARVAVTDRGRGLCEDAMHAGSGLPGLRERVGALGGSLTVEPVHGGGTRVVARLPVTTTRAAR